MPDAQESTDGIAEPFFMFATSIGNVRRNRLSDFENIPSNGKRAMKLDENEDLISVMLCTEAQDVLLSTQNGLTNRFNITDVRIFAGRDSNGVRGIRLQGSDRVISMAILDQGRLDMAERDAYLRQAMKLRQSQGAEDEGEIEEAGDESIQLSQERFQELNAQEQFILTLTENGYGKRSSAYEYRTTNRGSQGFTGIAVNKRNGGVVASFPVLPDDHIMLVTDQGRLIRCPIHDVRITRRSAQGVIIFRVDEDEKVVSVSRIPGGDEDDTAVNEEE
jgi:DNA gyrase subunit A